MLFCGRHIFEPLSFDPHRHAELKLCCPACETDAAFGHHVYQSGIIGKLIMAQPPKTILTATLAGLGTR